MAASAAVDEEMEHWRQQLRPRPTSASASASTASTTPRAFPSACGPSTCSWKSIPSYRERLVFVQIGVPTPDARAAVQGCSTTRWTTWSRRSTGAGAPKAGGRSFTSSSSMAPWQMMALHRLADFCIVSSLDDGMNLVAKEFVASRVDGDGVLDPEPLHRRRPRADQRRPRQSVRRRRGGRCDVPELDDARGGAPQAHAKDARPWWRKTTSIAGPAKSFRPCSSSSSPKAPARS